MDTPSIDQIITELRSSDAVTQVKAIRKTVPPSRESAIALPALFDLTFHDLDPLRSDCEGAIKRFGSIAVPFLRQQAGHESSTRREEAVYLLSECGCRYLTSVPMSKQVLDKRREELPDWGCDFEEIFALFAAALKDSFLNVRFAAASALEEFGQQHAGTIPVFMDVLAQGTSFQKNWAALHLGRIGPPAAAAREALANATQSTCWQTAKAARNALKLIAGHGIQESP